MADNTLYFGDNLDILREHLADESVDLIYLDPPFNSKKAYNAFLEEKNGSTSEAQMEAFDDTWHWTEDTARAYEETRQKGGSVADALVAFRKMLGQTDMMAYLANMAPRLVELQRVLKPTGSLYLHCDPVASHYLKVLMDAIFGAQRMQREIIWRIGWVSGFKTQANNWIRNHDVILYYTKTNEFTFNKPMIPYREGYRRRDGSKPTGKGIPVEDTWNCHPEDVSPSGAPLDSIMIKSFSQEKLGYPTQKPEALLERIVAASSNEGDLVLDPFCGCGTTVVVAERLNRKWIGIDLTYLAVGLMRRRLEDTFGEQVRDKYDVIGAPIDLAGAKALAAESPQQFELWALDLVGVPPAGQTGAGPDQGIDGRLYFTDSAEQEHEIIVSVKSGGTGPGDVRDLSGVIGREDAAIGVFVTLQPPTRGMEKEAASAGFWSPDKETIRGDGTPPMVPRIQILTVEQLLHGATIKCPYITHLSRGLREAPRSDKREEEDRKLIDE